MQAGFSSREFIFAWLTKTQDGFDFKINANGKIKFLKTSEDESVISTEPV